MDTTKKQSFIKYDIIIIISLLLLTTAHVLTNIIITSQAEITGADYDQIVSVHEANPLARWALRTAQLKAVFMFIMLPSFVGSLYYIVRRGGKEDHIAFISILFLLVGLLNVLNDVSILLGFLA